MDHQIKRRQHPLEQRQLRYRERRRMETAEERERRLQMERERRRCRLAESAVEKARGGMFGPRL